MSIATYTPEVWAKKLLSLTRRALVINAPGVVNHDYEGEIAQSGDSVNINSVGTPTIGDYVPGVTVIVPEQLTTAQRKLVITESKYFSFEVDDVDARQAAGDVMSEGLANAAFALKDVADRYTEGIMRAGVDAANALGATQVTTGAQAYELIVALGLKLDEADIPEEGRFVLIPPWVYSKLLLDDRFTRADATGSAAGSITGKVGDVNGMTIRKSNNLPLVTGDDYSVIAGTPAATSFADQIAKNEAYRPESSFSDAIKGLHLYGAKVVRPKYLATALASKT
ncbi:hypothetical protein UFOVP1360_48 [uncultured Caudovirales phage]|uniref:Major capsid protein Gp5 n=1 Tax=uncultured Caudovirales phage TaxID=2100421 RepID=A0A6J5RUK3_9CAUD|nr:hypothetical protein UFOVP1360_48 [uncultured Caudovirales phage]